MKKLFLFLSILLLAGKGFANDNPDDILGVWRDPENKGQIQIYKQNGKYYGKIVWLKIPKDPNGQPKLDKKNPNAALRSRPVMGLVMLRDFKYDDDEWSQGYIYDPSAGKEYKAYMQLKNKNTLAVRGYIGFSWLGKTMSWVRVK